MLGCTLALVYLAGCRGRLASLTSAGQGQFPSLNSFRGRQQALHAKSGPTKQIRADEANQGNAVKQGPVDGASADALLTRATPRNRFFYFFFHPTSTSISTLHLTLAPPSPSTSPFPIATPYLTTLMGLPFDGMILFRRQHDQTAVVFSGRS
jgi:hypothetical protein